MYIYIYIYIYRYIYIYVYIYIGYTGVNRYRYTVCIASLPRKATVPAEMTKNNIWGDQSWALPMTTILRSDAAAVYIYIRISMFLSIYIRLHSPPIRQSAVPPEVWTDNIWGDQSWALPMTTILRSAYAAVNI